MLSAQPVINLPAAGGDNARIEHVVQTRDRV